MPVNTVTTHFNHLAWSLQRVQAQSLQLCLNSTCLTCHKELFDSLNENRSVDCAIMNCLLSSLFWLPRHLCWCFIVLPNQVFRQLSDLTDMSNL